MEKIYIYSFIGKIKFILQYDLNIEDRVDIMFLIRLVSAQKQSLLTISGDI